MVIIRLSRAGSKKRPFYHIVVIDSRKRRDGKYIECAGYFNPVAKGQEVPLLIDVPMVEKWIGFGAQMSDKVSSLLKRYCKENAIQLSTAEKAQSKSKASAKTKSAASKASKSKATASKKTESK